MAEQSPFREDVLGGAVALITGGGSGIGFEITRQLGLHGARVVISGRREQVLKDACAQLNSAGVSAHYVQGDVRKYEDCERMVQEAVAKFDKLTILVNCAAGNFLSAAEQLSANGFRTVVEIDTVGTFNMSRASFAALKASSSALIINISAVLHYGATWYQTHSAAAKAAVDSITRSLALEWGTYNIRVVGIAPGPIEGTTGLTKLAPGTAEQVQEFIAKGIPLRGKAGTKWDIAIAAVFLATNAARFISGDTLVVDGASWIYREPIMPRDLVLATSKAMEDKTRGGGGKGKLASRM